MRQTIQVLPTDTIELDEDWGFPTGIKIGDLRLTLIGPKVVGGMLAALQDLQRELDDRDAREAGIHNFLQADGPLLVGNDEGELTRYMDEDAVYDRMRADEDAEELSEAGIE